MASRPFLLEATKPNPNAETECSENQGKRSITQLGGGSEVIYFPRFIPSERAWAWFDYLDKQIPWTRPLIHVFGRSYLQQAEFRHFQLDFTRMKSRGAFLMRHSMPRDTCYVASQGLIDLKYSGYQPHAYTWDEYPVLKDILKAVHGVLPGSRFNSLLLNRYKSCSDYVAWHSDNEKLYGPTPEIASVSFGCERKFLLKKKPAKKEAIDSSEELRKNQSKMALPNVHSFLLRHGSLLVMTGHTQRYWVHSVPKHSNPSSVRINLTFRQILP